MNRQKAGLAFAATPLLAGVLFVSLVPAAPSVSPFQEGREDLVQAHDNTNFPLVGRHRTVECGACHLEGVLAGTPTTCESCHWGRRQDDPYELQLGTQCNDCHNPQAWGRLNSSVWDHEIVTGFRLEGSHQTLDCMQCHGSRGFGGTIAACASCHSDDFESVQDPNHVAAGFPRQCEVCHTSTRSWEGAAFDHSAFRLRGRHRTAECAQCHGDGHFAGISSDCVSCHRADYERTTDPNHQQARFPTQCASCHGASARSWMDADFDHDRSFPLRGRHQTADCTACHQNDRFAGTPSNCVACHREEYDRATSPNHQDAGFPTNCEACHGSSANRWEDAAFDHDRAFPLLGRHRAAGCSQCHSNGRFAGTPSNCVACHRDEYDRTADPNHQQSGFGTDCQSCHGNSANRWEDASFDHDRAFPLLGRHRSADCTACHSNNRYSGTPSNCVACHRDDYERANDPNHQQSGFGTDCQTCHGNSANRWEGASFDHNRVFRLEGAHRGLDCQTCHREGYNLPTNCNGCHNDDYRSARSPDHVAAGFPTSCENCHRPSHTSWNQATFNHRFPLRGPHARDCSDCHRSSNYSQFTCTDCHAHEKSRMDEKHREEGGYVYNSQACLSCHRDGRED